LRLLAAEAAGAQIAVSSIVVFELWHGVFYSQNPVGNEERLTAFLQSVRTLPYDDHDAKVAGQIVADLRQRGRMIGPYDSLIAAQALRRDLLLVTGNQREFSRVPGLRIENWAS
jgi:tRNA(fMet)-specific endonuclease VapC